MKSGQIWADLGRFGQIRTTLRGVLASPVLSDPPNLFPLEQADKDGRMHAVKKAGRSERDRGMPFALSK